jgi:hypothetical protein
VDHEDSSTTFGFRHYRQPLRDFWHIVPDLIQVYIPIDPVTDLRTWLQDNGVPPFSPGELVGHNHHVFPSYTPFRLYIPSGTATGPKLTRGARPAFQPKKPAARASGATFVKQDLGERHYCAAELQIREDPAERHTAVGGCPQLHGKHLNKAMQLLIATTAHLLGLQPRSTSRQILRQMSGIIP